LFYEEDIKN